MSKINVSAPIKKILNSTVEKSPEILAICAVGGVIETARRAYKCRPKCDEILAAHKQKLERIAQNDTKARRSVYWETAKKIAPVVAPVIIMGGITILSVVFSHRITKKRLIAVTAAYNLADGSLKELQNKMTETLGEGKVRDIKDSIMKDKLAKNPPPELPKDENIQRNGEQRCYDSFSGRYFWTTWNKIGEAIVETTAEAMREMYVTVNDFYEKLNSRDMPPIEAGMIMGWRSDDAMNGKLPITISTLLTPNNEPCLCIDYNDSLVMV